MRYCNLTQFRVRVNVPSPIQLVWVRIRRVITRIPGLPNSIRQVIPPISHIAHTLHIRLIFTPCLTLSRAQINYHHRTHSYVIPLYLSMPWSWVDTMYNKLWVQHILSTAYTEYSIYPRFIVFASFSWLEVNPWMDFQIPACLSTRSTGISQLAIRPQWESCITIFPPFRVKWPMNTVTTPGMPSIHHPEEIVQSLLITAFKCISNLGRIRPPNAYPKYLNHSIQFNLQTCSIIASKLSQSWLPNASPNSLFRVLP